jgi:hypothetical protein
LPCVHAGVLLRLAYLVLDCLSLAAKWRLLCLCKIYLTVTRWSVSSWYLNEVYLISPGFS